MQISKHEEKMVNLQVQLRQNQAELQDYLADLDSWEADIKQKEVQLKSETQPIKNVSDLPPVRNTIHKKKLKKKKKEKIQDPNKPKKISGFDFRAWDKFDVDKALEEVDKEAEKKETSSSEYETDEEWELERKKHLAGQEKEKGNAHLKKGEYEQAVEAYTKGMEFDPTNAILAANRALALLKQQKFAAAELDCTSSIALDPLYVKAYLRRATARAGLGRLQEAIADFNRVLDLEPTNKQAKIEIERMQKELERDKEVPMATTLTEDERGRVKPIYKAPEERSKKALIRVPIEEIGLETRARPTPGAQQSDLTKKIVDKEKKEFDKLFSNKPSSEHTSSPDFVHLSDTKLQTDSKEISEMNSSKRAETNNDRLQTSNITVVEDSLQEKAGTTMDVNVNKFSENIKGSLPNGNAVQIKTTESGVGTKDSGVKSRGSKIKSKDVQVKSRDSGISLASDETGGQQMVKQAFSVPQSSFQFQADFKVLKNRPEDFYQYFKAIFPCDYSKLFGQSFDGDILVTILTSLEAYSDKVDLFDMLNGLTQVKRFSMAAMFLSRKDKDVARKLLNNLKESNNEERVAALRKKYDL